MKNIVANMIGGGVISVIICVVLAMVIPVEGLITGTILFALPGMIVGATLTILEYLKEMKDELAGVKKGEE